MGPSTISVLCLRYCFAHIIRRSMEYCTRQCQRQGSVPLISVAATLQSVPLLAKVSGQGIPVDFSVNCAGSLAQSGTSGGCNDSSRACYQATPGCHAALVTACGGPLPQGNRHNQELIQLKFISIAHRVTWGQD